MNGNALDLYSNEEPSHELAFNIFEGTWSTSVPGFGLGESPTFRDSRIAWLEEQCGGVAGKSVLELGPLEGGHTYMLANAGASHITAIESNAKAFLKCLLIQNAFKFEANFLYGDFRKYLAKRESKFDVVVASGVLYHMTDPISLLEDISAAADSVFLWTHYYDPDPAANNDRTRHHITAEPVVSEFRGRTIHLHRHDYLHFLNHDKFAGGSSPHSFWLTRESLIGVLEDLGMTVTVGNDDASHPHGPAITLFATRNPARYNFDENDYLSRYPDVADAVSKGQVQSGAQHYFLFGRAEGRSASIVTT